MIENILYLIYGTLILLFGVYLSAAMTGIRLNRRNHFILLLISAVCGALQMGSLLLFSTWDIVWELYPLTTHLPLVILLCVIYHKRLITVLTAVLTAYLCCQPSKWFGILIFSMTGSILAEYIARMCILPVVLFLVLKLFAPYLSELFNRECRSVCLLMIMPAVYYVFDYATAIYTNLWISNNRIVAEFLPFMYSVVFIFFSVMYYREYEQKADAERREKIVRITAEQQIKEMEAVRRIESELRLLRHDVRFFLNNLALCIDSDEKERAHEMISSYSSYIEGTKLTHFCHNDTINYVLSDFSAKFQAQKIDFVYSIELEDVTVDEILFSSILSNALDNALNAMEALPEAERRVHLMLKTVENKLLLSVKNPIHKKPAFADGLPVSEKKGHGYGTQSIRYMSERLGGNCRFSAENQTFTVQVII